MRKHTIAITNCLLSLLHSMFFFLSHSSPLPLFPIDSPPILTQPTTFITFPSSSSPKFLSSPSLSHSPSLLPSPYPSSHLIPSHVSTTHPPTRTRTICSLPPTPSPWVAARTLLSSWYVRTYVRATKCLLYSMKSCYAFNYF